MSSGDRDRRGIPLDKIIFVIACAYLGSVVAWLISQKNAAVPPKSAISPEDSQFIAYLQSSLQVIDRQSKTVTANKATPVVPSPSPSATMPPPPPTNLPANSPRVIERVYVPVYPQTPQIPPQQTPATPPKIAVAPPTQNPPIVNPPQVALVIPTNDKIKNTLVGVMELGDRSAALFDNQGITTRISTGEFINGWILIGVQNQQVILSRNGKTKVVEVGQSF